MIANSGWNKQERKSNSEGAQRFNRIVIFVQIKNK